MFGFDNVNVIDWNQCNDIDIKVYLEDRAYFGDLYRASY